MTNDKEDVSPWTFYDWCAILFYGAPLHMAATFSIVLVRWGAHLSNHLSRANNRFFSSFRPGGKRLGNVSWSGKPIGKTHHAD